VLNFAPPESLLAQIHKREQGTAAIKDELARSPHRLQTNGKELESLKAAIISRMGKFQDLTGTGITRSVEKLSWGPCYRPLA
jgi:hypothetical protein